MHQTVDEQLVQTNEETKAGHAGNHAFENVAYLIQHKVTLQPVRHVAGCFIGTTFGHGAVLAQLQHLFHRIVVAAGFGGVPFVTLLLRQQILDRTVQGKVRITTDRRREVGVRLQRQTEVAAVFRIVDRLLHGAQQHGLQHFCIRTIADGFQQLGVIARLWLVATRQFQAQFSQHGAE